MRKWTEQARRLSRTYGSKEGSPNRLPKALRLLGIGWYIAFCIVAGIVIGVFVDEALDKKPLFTMLGLFAGLLATFAGVYALVRDALSISRPPSRKDG